MAGAGYAVRRTLDLLAKTNTFAFLNHTATLNPLVISQCNGIEPFAFGEAWLAYKPSGDYDAIPFGFLFQDGIECLIDMVLELEKGDADKYSSTENTHDAEKKASVACIKKYLTEDFEKHEKCLLSLEDLESEVQVKAVLAVHLFAPLIPDSPGVNKYGIDKQHFPKDEGQTKCPTCGEKLRFTDTSFGHSEVWHGYTDIILQKSAVKSAVTVSTKLKESSETRRWTRQEAELDEIESDSDASVSSSSSSSSYSAVEDNKQFNNQKQAEARALAQTITNAFCEQSYRDRFKPSFLATNEKVKIFMYCCDKDVLLETDYMSILEKKSVSIKCLTLVWLALNFDFFQRVDIFDEKSKIQIHYKWPVSNFQKIIGEAPLELYQYKACRPLRPGRNEEVGERKMGIHEEFFRLALKQRDVYHLEKHIDMCDQLKKFRNSRIEDKS
ncbi:uncharacterized protein LOC123543930 [Mercenaria mercenaria]|uniref:uncharacterized protein LOC123543930 n=1 Tax=Mercenaria mercenaria TaxID=6596 RepID=UPI00234FAC9E|nr:uncharacterized protein LOC123543930 [Mercenaria mercenaria]